MSFAFLNLTLVKVHLFLLLFSVQLVKNNYCSTSYTFPLKNRTEVVHSNADSTTLLIKTILCFTWSLSATDLFISRARHTQETFYDNISY